MADTKITALAAIGANPINVATFPIPMVDLLDTSMAASGTTKKVTVNQILGAGGTATLASATITGDLTVRTNKLAVTSTNVGIGTASPTLAAGVGLEIENAGITTLRLQNTSGANAFELQVDSDANGVLYRGYNNSPHVFYVNNSTAMTLNANGLGVGRSPSYRLQASSGTKATTASIATVGAITTTDADDFGIYFRLKTDATGANRFAAITAFDNGSGNGARDLVLQDLGGNVGIGVTPINRLTVAGNMAVGGTGNNGLQFHSGSPVSGNLVWWLTNDQANSNILNLYYYSAGVFSGRAFVVNQSGNFMVRTPATPPTIPDTEMMVFNLTSNTNLRVSVKGTDGVTRTANLTLA